MDVRPTIVLITLIVVLAAAGLILLAMSVHDVQQYEKGVVFRFGRLLPDIRGPGLRVIRPIGDRMRKVSVQTEDATRPTLPDVPAATAPSPDSLPVTANGGARAARARLARERRDNWPLPGQAPDDTPTRNASTSGPS